jgi:tetratricopeptide (TPR) repeat protein
MKNMAKSLALILSILLMTSIGLVTASSQDNFSSSLMSSDRISRSRVESLLKEVEELLDEARKTIDQAEDAGLDVQIYRGVFEAAQAKYQEGLELYNNGDYDKAFSTLIYVKTRVQIIIKALQGVVGEKPSVKPSIQMVENKLKSLEDKYEELESTVIQQTELESLEDQLKQAYELIAKAKEILDVNYQAAYSLLMKAEDILKQVEEAIIVSSHTTSRVTKTEVEASPVVVQPTPKTTITESTLSTFTSILQPSATELETTQIGEVNIELEKKDGEYKVVVEHVERLIRYENGTVLINREKIVTVGDKTIVSISKELVYGKNESRSIGQVSVEREQNIVGAWLKVSMNAPPEIYNLDKVIEAQIVEAEKNRVRIRLKAPDNTSGKLFIIELSPELVDIENILGFNLTVNSEKAILASSLLDLASGIYDQPAYVFVISAKGVQILLYIPHFSEYIIEINAIIQRILEVFKENLQRIFTIQAATYATIVATIILITSTAIMTYQKKYLHKIK